MMDKQAAASKILKSIGKGVGIAGAVGGAGFIGNRMGRKSGSSETAKKMTAEFERYNKQENMEIANHFLRRGYRAGLSSEQMQG